MGTQERMKFSLATPYGLCLLRTCRGGEKVTHMMAECICGFL